jgi:hypothetical protein
MASWYCSCDERHSGALRADALTKIAREDARSVLLTELRIEADAFVDEYAEIVRLDGSRRLERHGYGQDRTI